MLKKNTILPKSTYGHEAYEMDKRQAAVWNEIIKETKEASQSQSIMSSFFHRNVLKHSNFQSSISFYLASLLGNKIIPPMTVQSVFVQAFESQPSLLDQMLNDLLAYYTRDAACDQYVIPLLYYKGFHAIQSYRISHWLWRQERRTLAMYFQNRISEVFDVDIHPAATLGSGIMLDHASGLVVGETSVIGDDVSIMHAVTLGGSGAEKGDRHPKIGNGVLISAGAKILGNLNVEEGAKIGAGSVVLSNVDKHSTVVGVPARQVGKSLKTMPSLDMDHNVEE